MEHHLRLAEARGSLRAPNSPVQDRGLEMCIIFSERRHQEVRIDGVKRIMLGSQPTIEAIHTMFPEYFPDDFLERLALSKAVDEYGEFDIDRVDDSKILWRAQGVTKDEDDEITRWIRDRETGGSISLADMDEGWR